MVLDFAYTRYIAISENLKYRFKFKVVKKLFSYANTYTVFRFQSGFSTID